MKPIESPISVATWNKVGQNPLKYDYCQKSLDCFDYSIPRFPEGMGLLSRSAAFLGICLLAAVLTVNTGFAATTVPFTPDQKLFL